MEIFEGHRALFRPLARPAITIGNFDGVHLGHRQLLAQTRIAANALQGDAVALTFEPHPATFLAPDRVPPRITSKSRRLELLASCGIDVAILETFDKEFASISADDFSQVVLHDVLQAAHVVVGHDFRYGTDRCGTIESLRMAGERLGFAVEVIDPVEIDGIRTSSSAIRSALLTGNLGTANQLLGRDYDVDGPVVRGAGRGRELGIPTANVDPQGVLLPCPGIYATRVEILETGKTYMAATSLGTNPTFVHGGALTLEPHLLDFEGDLYNQQLRVSFVKQLRAEERFDGVDALLAQIHVDIAMTRQLLK